MSKIFEEFDNLVDAVLNDPSDQKALASLAEWFQIYNNYDWGGDMYNIDGSHGLRILKAEDGTEYNVTFNVANGIYYMTEDKAPTSYRKNSYVYRIVVGHGDLSQSFFLCAAVHFIGKVAAVSGKAVYERCRL